MKQYTQNYQGFEVRCVEDENNVIWFVAKDILEAVGIKVTNSITKYISHIPEEWKGGSQITTLGGIQQIQCLTEEGVNFFLFRSDKPKALPMQKWIAGEVLPSLRKHGGYVVGQETMSKEEYLASALIMAKSVLDEKDGVIKEQSQQINVLSFMNASLEDKVKMLKPKEDFFDSVNHSVNAIDFKTFAGMLISQATKKPYGRNTLLKDLRNHGILNAKNQPYQQYAHYFDVITATKNNQLVTTTYVKPNGVTFISGKLKSIGLAA